jgi:DNA/RNA endonuclease YhcR with UshA esterase domain
MGDPGAGDQTLTVLIPETSLSQFPIPPEQAFAGQTVCVVGVVLIVDNRPQVLVNLPSQIVVL